MINISQYYNLTTLLVGIRCCIIPNCQSIIGTFDSIGSKDEQCLELQCFLLTKNIINIQNVTIPKFTVKLQMIK